MGPQPLCRRSLPGPRAEARRSRLQVSLAINREAAPIIDELSVEWHTANVGPRLKRRRKQQKSRLERQLRKEGVKVEDWSV